MHKPHKKLDVWNAAMELVVGIFKRTANFPKDQRFGLADQMRRAAVSVPSNIAEGAARQTKKEFMNFLFVAKGSLSELDTQLELAMRLDYLDATSWRQCNEQTERIDQMLSGLIRRQRAIMGKRAIGAGL